MFYLIWFIGIIICVLSFIIYLAYFCDGSKEYKKYIFEHEASVVLYFSLFSWVTIIIIVLGILLFNLLDNLVSKFVKYLSNKIF